MGMLENQLMVFMYVAVELCKRQEKGEWRVVLFNAEFPCLSTFSSLLFSVNSGVGTHSKSVHLKSYHLTFTMKKWFTFELSYIYIYIYIDMTYVLHATRGINRRLPKKKRKKPGGYVIVTLESTLYIINELYIVTIKHFCF